MITRLVVGVVVVEVDLLDKLLTVERVLVGTVVDSTLFEVGLVEGILLLGEIVDDKIARLLDDSVLCVVDNESVIVVQLVALDSVVFVDVLA